MSGKLSCLVGVIGILLFVPASTSAQAPGSQQHGSDPPSQLDDTTRQEADKLVRRYADIVRYVQDSNDYDISEIERRIGFNMTCTEMVANYHVDEKLENAIAALSCSKKARSVKRQPNIDGVTYAFQAVPPVGVRSRIRLVFLATNSFPSLSAQMTFEARWEGSCPGVATFKSEVRPDYTLNERALLHTPTMPKLLPSEAADFILEQKNGRRVGFELREYEIGSKTSCTISVLLSSGLFK